MNKLILYTIYIILFSIPIFWIYRIIESFFKIPNKILTNRKLSLIKDYAEGFYTSIVLFLCLIGFILTNNLIGTGYPLKIYHLNERYIKGYTSLSFSHILTIYVFFALGLISYAIIKKMPEKLPPIPYVISCSLLIINIVFSIIYFLHTRNIDYKTNEDRFVICALRFGLICLSLMYIVALKESMNQVSNTEKTLNKKYKSKFMNKILQLFIKYQTMPALWIITLFPVLIIIQLILVLFGQKPDSFIKAFFDTSDYNYSKVVPPSPIIIPGDDHYLCTVSLKGHKKLVKPLRSGIRHGNKILVNRQLLIANAFENILEEYTPRLHKLIRYVYDKYGYPLSKHINTPYTADLIYIFMKPLEWFFLLVLYCVDKNPENRINIQYSELRK